MASSEQKTDAGPGVLGQLFTRLKCDRQPTQEESRRVSVAGNSFGELVSESKIPFYAIKKLLGVDKIRQFVVLRRSESTEEFEAAVAKLTRASQKYAAVPDRFITKFFRGKGLVASSHADIDVILKDLQCVCGDMVARFKEARHASQEAVLWAFDVVYNKCPGRLDDTTFECSVHILAEGQQTPNIGQEALAAVAKGSDEKTAEEFRKYILKCKPTRTYTKEESMEFGRRAIDNVQKMGCRVCKADTSKTCGICKVAKYCCREHQKQDWSTHKKMCEFEKVHIKHAILAANGWIGPF